MRIETILLTLCHQCLSAESLVRTCNSHMKTNKNDTSHQCLSAESLVRTPRTQVIGTSKTTRHQCLSAESLVRTHGKLQSPLMDRNTSPMPFG